MGAVGYTGGDPEKVDVAGDTMTGPLVLPGDPSSDLEAATKGYVDAHSGGGGGGGVPATTVTSETSFGITPAVGVGTKYARDDHTHGSPAAPTAASVGAATAGHNHAGTYDPAGSASAALSSALAADPTPGGTVVTETTFGQSSSAGAAGTYSRSDHTHGTPSAPSVPSASGTVSSETSFGVAANAGAATSYSRGDHTHGTPAAPTVPTAGGTVVAETSYGQSSSAGAAATFSRSDHTHGTPAATDISGKVTGPASATDNAIMRFDGTTGKTAQGSLITLSDVGTFILPPVTGVGYANGQLFYDPVERCLCFHNAESDVTMNVGHELWLIVRNETGSTITNGAAVYVNGTHATGIPTIALARANTEATAVCVGITTHSIENNTYGFVTTDGVVHGLDTSAYSGGDVLYLSAAVAGALTVTRPVAPNIEFRIGIVTRANPTQGSINVDPGVRRLGNGTANQLYGMDNAGTTNEWKTLVAGSGMTVSGGPGGIVLSSSGGSATLPLSLNPKATRRTAIPSGRAGSNFTPTINRLYLVPLPMRVARTLTEIAVEIATAAGAGGLLRAMLLASDSQGDPTTAIADYGTLASDSTGVKPWVISQALSANTLYWVGINPTVAAPVLRAVDGYNPYVSIVGNLTGTTSFGAYVMNSVSGALGATPFTYFDVDIAIRVGVQFS